VQGGRWWSARYLYLHQQLLADWANALYTAYKANMDRGMGCRSRQATWCRWEINIRFASSYR
jgi:hypothetical protein